MSYYPRRKGAKGKSKKRQEARKSIYDKQREEETIRNAKDRGYLRRMTIAVLNECTGLNDCDLPTLAYLNMTSSQLSSVGVLSKCANLRICILPENYITNFEPLINCVHLSVLDLHSNQIKSIPPNNFWAALTKLQILHLHDNSLSTLQTIHFLSSSPSIMALTLYDTPLSLKKNYRHHLVNGMWSLKALDGYIISDEEIIEDISMCEMFSMKNENLKVYTEHRLTKGSTMKQATLHFENVIRNINKTQAKFCPVVIIQKMIRGHLARKRYKHMMETRIWAAITIQRCFRFHKGISTTTSRPLPPPSSPFSTRMTGQSRPDLDEEKNLVTYGDHGNALTEQSRAGIETDKSLVTRALSEAASDGRYRSYTHGQTSKISNLSRTSNLSKIDDKSSTNYMSSSFLLKKKQEVGSEIGVNSNRELINYKSSSLASCDLSGMLSKGSVKSEKKQLTIDLSMLEAVKWEKTETEEGKKTKTGDSAEDGKSRLSSINKSERNKSRKTADKSLVYTKSEPAEDDLFGKKTRLKPEMVGKYQTVRVFLGSVLEKTVEIDETEAGGILLSGGMPPQQRNEPVVEMHLSKKEMAADTRRCLQENKYRLQKQVKKPVQATERATTERHLFLRTHGTMSLACLRAVHQAYRDRKQAQDLVDKAAVVSEMKERRNEVTNRQHTLRQDYHENVFATRIQDGVNIADALQASEVKQNELHKTVSARRLNEVTNEQRHKAEMKFIKDFATQQTSVSQALRSHDRAEFNRQKLEKLAQIVHRIRESNLKQKALVQRYLEHGRLIKQAEKAHSKAKLDKFLTAKAQQVSIEAESRMTQRNSRKVQHFYPLSPLNVPVSNMSLAVAPLQDTTEESSSQTFSSFNETTSSELFTQDV